MRPPRGSRVDGGMESKIRRTGICREAKRVSRIQPTLAKASPFHVSSRTPFLKPRIRDCVYVPVPLSV